MVNVPSFQLRPGDVISLKEATQGEYLALTSTDPREECQIQLAGLELKLNSKELSLLTLSGKAFRRTLRSS
jgi:ribosomal protein S4